MTRLLSQTLMIGLTGLSAAAYFLTLGWPQQELLLSCLALAIILLSLILERLYPHDRRWNISQQDGWGDTLSLGLILGLIEPALKWAFSVLLLWAMGDAAGPVAALALGWQIMLVFAVIELGAYISHWLHHNSRILWPLHAVHHSPTRLYTLNNFRFHPLNYALNSLASILPALAIGASPAAILGYVALTYPAILLQHSNVRFDMGWLNYVLNTNEVHRWHHSTRPTEGHRNFGRALVIWDQVFGTFALPGGAPRHIGLFSSSRGFPANSRFLAQLWFPCGKTCCR